ncbi:MAG: hypothetical protein QG594_2378 [Bacteroidota bacterium]|nr:hypothetical protein [Bacteroidota bacterium]
MYSMHQIKKIILKSNFIIQLNNNKQTLLRAEVIIQSLKNGSNYKINL